MLGIECPHCDGEINDLWKIMRWDVNLGLHLECPHDNCYREILVQQVFDSSMDGFHYETRQLN